MNNNFENKDLLNFIEKFINDRVNMLEKIDNTSYNDILRLRGEAAEIGVEMTPQEVFDLIMFIKEVIS